MKGDIHMEKEILLGFTEENEVIFGNVAYRNGRFSVSFHTSYPMEITTEKVIEQIEIFLEQMDKNWVMDRLESYDCKPSELAEELRKDSYDVVADYFDNSLYPEAFRIEGVEDDIYFLASSSGQLDSRGNMSTYVNKDLYDAIHELWDEYHLKEVPFEKVEGLFEAIDHQNNTIEDYKVIENWLKRNFK